MKRFQFKKKKLRPTSSKVLGAIFSILGHRNLEGKIFLDLYAGTGAVGIKSLELGASQCFFVDINNKFLQNIKKKLEKYGFVDKGKFIRANCENQLSKVNGSFDFIFVDPPYKEDPFENIITQIVNGGLSNEKTVLILEHSSRQNIDKSIKIFNMQGQKEYGDSCISIFSRE